MKRLVVVLLLALIAGAHADEALIALDGDTLRVGSDRVRLIGFDTPETYFARCNAERELGYKATARMRTLLATTEPHLDYRSYRDKYGRKLATLYLNGENASVIMVREGLAVPYSGHTKRIDWCQKLG